MATSIPQAAKAAAIAASKFKGRYAVHPLLAGSAQLIADSCKERISPSWTLHAQELLTTWRAVAPCMPKYAEFLKKTNKKDLKRIHVFMNENAQAKLGEFYLCCALQLRREEVDANLTDAQKLLDIAQDVANKEVEPFFESCRKFVADYDENLHKRLDNTTIWREVDDALFWHHSFEAVSPQDYLAFQRVALPHKDTWPSSEDSIGVDAALDSCASAIANAGEARVLAEDVYKQFLEASSTPVKANMRAVLIDHGIIWGEVNYRGLDDVQGSE